VNNKNNPSMKKITTLFTAFAILQSAFFTQAQNYKTCGSDEAQKLVFDQHPELLREYLEREEEYIKIDKAAATNGYADQRTQSVVYIVPVVFHIIHQNGPENISDAKVRDAIKVMNDDFRKLNADTALTIPLFKPIMADCEIEFRLATIDPSGNCTNGINRMYSWETNNGGESAKLVQWPQNKYLNIWVVKTMGPSHATAAAYSYLPGSAPTGGDGIITLYNYVGTNPGNSHTLSHEVGHWLNLRHTWGSGNQPNVACGTDNVTDTPTTKGSPSSCNLNLSTCATPAIENVQNHMDYSFCTTMFTLGQKTRMRAALTATTAGRSNLWTSTNLAATGTAAAPQLCAAEFITNNLNGIVCANGVISFSDVSYNGLVTSRQWTFPGGILAPGSTSLTDSVVSIQYPTAGVYDVILDVSNGVSSFNVTKSQAITVLSNTAAYSGANYTESFETSALPNTDWEVKSPDNGSTTWSQFSAAASSGTSCAFIENFISDSADVDELISPTINIQSIANPVFTFKLAFRRKTAQDADVLKIWTSTDCGKNWAIRKTISGAALATVTTPSTAYFIPGATNWRQETVSIANLLNSTNARIKFQFTCGDGNNIYIDDVNIIGNTGIDNEEIENTQISLFPNPSDGTSQLNFELKSKQKVTVLITNLLGQTIDLIDLGEQSAGLKQIKINENGNYGAGVYFIKVQINSKVYTQKLVLN
jgi:hypothetical protein